MKWPSTEPDSEPHYPPAERDSKEQLEAALARVGALEAAALAEGAYDEAAKHRCQEL